MVIALLIAGAIIIAGTVWLALKASDFATEDMHKV
jgi:hypothetical protein